MLAIYRGEVHCRSRTRNSRADESPYGLENIKVDGAAVWIAITQRWTNEEISCCLFACKRRQSRGAQKDDSH